MWLVFTLATTNTATPKSSARRQVNNVFIYNIINNIMNITKVIWNRKLFLSGCGAFTKVNLYLMINDNMKFL